MKLACADVTPGELLISAKLDRLASHWQGMVQQVTQGHLTSRISPVNPQLHAPGRWASRQAWEVGSVAYPSWEGMLQPLLLGPV